jgi:hypothetical protein
MARTEPKGSTAIIFTSGFFSFIFLPIPEIVPAVPFNKNIFLFI